MIEPSRKEKNMEQKLKFPSDFLWGASTSAFQVEGGWNEGGRGIANSDVRNIPSGLADYKGASDHYHHMKEDVGYMKELGIKVYRFSFSWTRIMPDGHHVNQEGLNFYHSLIDELISQDIIPFPTLYHFEMPYALIEKFGGWADRKCVDAYVQYATVCFQEFKDQVKMWATINEQMCATAPDDMNGNLTEDDYLRQKTLYQMSYHMTLAEKIVIAKFKELIPDGQIGHVVAMQEIYPETSSPQDVLAALNAQDELQWSFLDLSINGQYSYHFQSYLKQKYIYPQMNQDDLHYLTENKPDFIGINYYASCCVRAKKEFDDCSKMPPFYQSDQFYVVENKCIQATEWMHFGIDPDGLYMGLRQLYDRYELPMIITENGMAYSDQLMNGEIQDNYRIDYLKQHLKKCHQFIQEGYPLIGYCPWSLLDLVSSHEGFSKRYGLIYVDRTNDDMKSCERIKKKSFYWYQNIIQNNGIEGEE